MADLASLYTVAPGMGAFFTGQQQNSDMATADSERQRLAAIIQKLQIDNQQSQAMNPLLLQHQGLENSNLEAQIPGTQADSRLKGTNADFAAQTLAGKVAATNSDNQTKMTADQAKQVNDIGSLFASFGDTINQSPDMPGARAALFRQLATQSGLDKTPTGQALITQFAQTPSAQLGDTLKNFGISRVKMSEPYMQATDTEAMRAKSALDVENLRGKYQLQNTQAQIAGGRWQRQQVGADLKSQVQSMLTKAAGNVEGQYSILTQAAYMASQQGLAADALDYAQRAKAIEPLVTAKVGGNKPPGIDVGAASGMPTTPPINIRSPILDGIGGGNPANPTPPAGQSQTAPPAGAIQMLKANPNLRGAFDAKYGQGASAKVLGQ